MGLNNSQSTEIAKNTATFNDPYLGRIRDMIFLFELSTSQAIGKLFA